MKDPLLGVEGQASTDSAPATGWVVSRADLVPHTNTAVLDLLRAAMALWVFADHALARVGLYSVPFFSQAGAGVDVFMMISGFLMVHQARHRQAREPWKSRRTWARFYVRRFFRIAPLYYVAFFFCVLLAHPYAVFRHLSYNTFPPPWKTALPPGPGVPWMDHVLLHLSFLFGLFPRHAADTPLPDWSLSLEMQFYAVYPVLLWGLQRLGYVATAALSLVLVGWARTHWGGLFPQPSILPLKLTCFVTGTLLAEAMHHLQERPAKAVTALVLAVYVSAIDQFWLFPILSGLVAVCVCGPRVPMLEAKPIVWLAETSYGIYLLHSLILWPLSAGLARAGLSNAPPIYRVVVILGLSTPLVGLFAWIAHRHIERPLIEVGRKLSARI